MVLSHSDSDHLAAVDELFAAYTVKKVLRTGLERTDSRTWREANNAIRNATDTLEINLKDAEFPIGATYQFGETQTTCADNHVVYIWSEAARVKDIAGNYEKCFGFN